MLEPIQWSGPGAMAVELQSDDALEYAFETALPVLVASPASLHQQWLARLLAELPDNYPDSAAPDHLMPAMGDCILIDLLRAYDAESWRRLPKGKDMPTWRLRWERIREAYRRLLDEDPLPPSGRVFLQLHWDWLL